MARAKLQIHPLGLAVICFALVAWLIALGGVSGAALSCARGQEAALAAAARAEAAAAAAAAGEEALAAAAPAAAANETTAIAPPPPLAAATVEPPPPQSSTSTSAYVAYATCAQAYQWEWFSLWFCFALLVALFATAFLPDAFRRGRAALLAFSTLATLCLLLSAHNFITRVDISVRMDVRDLNADSINAAAAGFVLLALAMMSLMLALGSNFSCAACSASSAGGLPHGALLGGVGAFEGGACGVGGGGAGGTDYGAHVRYQASPPI